MLGTLAESGWRVQPNHRQVSENATLRPLANYEVFLAMCTSRAFFVKLTPDAEFPVGAV
jgi:hypothetical protein